MENSETLCVFDKKPTDCSVLRSAIRESGYVVVRNVLSANQISDTRRKCNSFLKEDPCEETEIKASEFVALEEFTSVPFNSKVIGILKLIVGGDVTYYPNFVVRINRYTNWHIDNGFHPDFHNDPSHLFSDRFSHLQCMTYLQGNDENQGGGLDVIHGSHKWYQEGSAPQLSEMKVDSGQMVSLNTKAGDLIVFDGRLIHRGTPAVEKQVFDSKYGVFWSASGVDPVQSDKFVNYLKGRVDYLINLGLTGDYLKYMVNRYNDVLSIQYPESFNNSLRDFIREENIEMISIGV